MQRTFLHLPRIGLLTEQKLWRQGVKTWDDLEAAHGEPPSLFEYSGSPLRQAITASRKALEAQDAAFFAQRLPPREHYRIAAEFPTQTVFLDIETTGLSLYYDTITLIGCARDGRYACHIMGIGDDYSNAVVDLIREAKCLVTFNGTIFDLKFLAKYLPALHLPEAHVDLRYLVRRVSLKGGQKEVEKALGLERSGPLADVDGARAVLLWYEYISGNTDSGRRLVSYNYADVEGMKLILDHAIARIADTSGGRAVDRMTTRFGDENFSARLDRPPAATEVPPFAGRAETAVDYDRLTASMSGELCVVGIDLTGSEARPSGWCELRGPVASTRMIASDDELIAAIVDADADLVSIDCPLTLPAGRRAVGDDDPTRQEFGIMRACERTLKRRGINVYPCLIPSMQRLTARGIRLANTLRARGTAVIESYPGAAQDIMKIPRKRAGLEHLKKGLQRFGIQGVYVHGKVTHDELDAITSAIVGLYFWAGRFDALGKIDEDYLIVPDLHRTAPRRRVVGISGSIAAGKTTAARMLERAGFVYGRYSKLLADLARKQGGRADRETLQQLGQRIHADPGQRWLNNRLLCQMDGRAADTDLVIDGLRWPEDRAFWVERFGPMFQHIHISTPAKLRRDRYLNGGGSLAEFDAATRHYVEGGICELRSQAHLTIENDQTVDYMRHLLAVHFDADLPAAEV